jgi:gamma-glutamyl:cysteine ligase YbdK (ATP-grasp superfamily)
MTEPISKMDLLDHMSKRCDKKQKAINSMEEKFFEIQHEINQIDESIKTDPKRYVCPASSQHAAKDFLLLKQNNWRAKTDVYKRQLEALITAREDARIHVGLDKMRQLTQSLISSSANIDSETSLEDLTPIIRERNNLKALISEQILTQQHRHLQALKKLTTRLTFIPEDPDLLNRISKQKAIQKENFDLLLQL